METRIKLHNRFDVEVTDSKTGKLKQRAYAENIILNQAWAQFMSDIDWFTNIYFGTGSGTISAARTTLFAPLSNKVAANSIFSENIAQNWFSHRQSIAILENEHVGVTLTEVGIGTPTVLCTHAALKDMNGNPVSIVKTDTDIITIYATVYARPNTVSSDMVGIDIVRTGVANNPLLCTILGKRLNVILSGAPRVMNGWAFLLRAGMSDTLAGINEYETAVIPSTFDVANKKATWYHRIPAASANTGGIKRYALHGNTTYIVASAQMPAIIGRLNTETMTQAAVTEQIGTGDGIKTDFGTTFPFVRTGAVIKVDGVVASPTIMTGKPNAPELSGFIRVRTNAERPDKKAFGISLTSAEILENPFYEEFGITSISGRQFVLESSDDSNTWTTAVTATAAGTISSYTVPSDHRNKRYFKISLLAGQTSYLISSMESFGLLNYKNIRFSTPPAAGAVITAEYTCDCDAKDANHVTDISVVIQLGEYTP